MTRKQKESTAKYLYDVSKGIALLAVVGNIVQNKWETDIIVFGMLAAIGFFLWGYYVEGGLENE